MGLLQYSFKEIIPHSLKQLFPKDLNKCQSCEQEGSVEKKQDRRANKHIHYLLKYEGKEKLR